MTHWASVWSYSLAEPLFALQGAATLGPPMPIIYLDLHLGGNIKLILKATLFGVTNMNHKQEKDNKYSFESLETITIMLLV